MMISITNNSTFICLIKKCKITLFFLFISCNSKLQIDYVGSSNFYVKNTFDTDILVTINIPDSENSCEIIIINPGKTELIYSASDFGCNPTPELVFSNLKIEKSDNTLIYEQNPIINSKWKVEYKNRDQKDFYHSDYYLIYN